MAGGLLLSIAPAFAFLVAALLLFRFRETVAEAAWRMLTTVPDTVHGDGPQAAMWRPGRNLCRLLVWTGAVGCLALALSSII